MESSSVSQHSATRDKGFIHTFIKHKVLNYLKHMNNGLIRIEDGRETYGNAVSRGIKDVAIIRVTSPEFYSSIFFRGSVGAAEAYMDKYWSTPDLLQVVRFFCSNIKLLQKLKMNQFLPMGGIEKLIHLMNNNSKAGSKKNISMHYDLGNDFFKLFLDETMMYSSGVFSQPNDTMKQASLNKLNIICDHLQLTPSDHLLEIGTGWGGLAVHAATSYGCKVTTTTISREQYEYTTNLVKEKNLEHKITVLLKDYRDLEGKFDKLVSIEMIEAVGHKYYKSYFSQCDHLVKSGGLIFLQAITMPGQRYKAAKNSVDFIQKYIFPGGSLPSLEVISENLTSHTNMQIIHINDITQHYADTLMQWRKAFSINLDKVYLQGFDKRFCRMWDYYLSYCEGGFRERIINTHHILMLKTE